MIYLDHAAATKINPIALEAIKTAPYANPHSIHIQGLEAASHIKESEDLVKDCINGHKGKFVWLSSASLANYFVIDTHANKDPDSFLYEQTAHKSISGYGRRYKSIQSNTSGLISFPNLDLHLTENTKLVSVLYVNNETGIKQIGISQLKKKIKNAYLHVDAVQAAGKIQVDVEELACDYLTMSGHKFGTPKGIACLWVREGAPLKIPYLGTPPVPMISAFAKTLDSINLKKVQLKLKEKESIFLKQLEHCASLNNVEFDYNTKSICKVNGILSINFKGVDASELFLALSSQGVAVSTGSACNSKQITPSRVLMAMKVPQKDVLSTIRISFAYASCNADLDEGIFRLIETIKELLNNGSEPPEDN